MSPSSNAHLAAGDIRRILDAASDAVRSLDRVAEEAPEVGETVDMLRAQLRAVSGLARSADETVTEMYDRVRAV